MQRSLVNSYTLAKSCECLTLKCAMSSRLGTRHADISWTCHTCNVSPCSDFISCDSCSVVQRAWQESPCYWHPRAESTFSMHWFKVMISPLWLTEISTLSSLQILWRNASNDTSISNWHIGYIWLHTAASHGFRQGHQATSIATRIATGLQFGCAVQVQKGHMPGACRMHHFTYFYLWLYHVGPIANPFPVHVKEAVLAAAGKVDNKMINHNIDYIYMIKLCKIRWCVFKFSNRCWLFKTGASKITSWWKRKERRNLPRNRSMAWRSAVAFWKHRREHVARGRLLAYLQGGWILWVFYFTKKQSDRHMYDLSQHADNSGCFTGDTPFAKVAKVTMMEKAWQNYWILRDFVVIEPRQKRWQKSWAKDTTSSTHVFDIPVFGQPVACFAPSSLFVAGSSVTICTSFHINPTLMQLCNYEGILVSKILPQRISKSRLHLKI